MSECDSKVINKIIQLFGMNIYKYIQRGTAGRVENVFMFLVLFVVVLIGSNSYLWIFFVSQY